MLERRTKRSPEPHEAIQLLLEAFADRSRARAVALVNMRGRMLAGAGGPEDVVGLAKFAAPLARGECFLRFEGTGEASFAARTVTVGETTVCLAALGARAEEMHDTVFGISRIVAS
jgi:hypothetical protein